MNANDVGKYFTTNGDDIWMLITYCDHPTATMQNVRTGEQRDAVGCLNLQPFVKLIPEKEIPHDKD